MSEDFDFNPKKKEDDKGVGKIRLDKEGTPDATKAAAEKAASGTRKKWLIGGGAAVVGVGLILGLAGVFNNSSTPVQQPVTPPPVVQVDPGVTPPPVVQQVNASQLQAQSIRAKEASIYRDAARSYYQTDARGNRTGGTGEAYMNINGQEVQRGQDFALHVQLFDKGQVSLFVAAGPYAGSRIEFTPVGTRGGSSITYSRVGQEARGSDGQTVVYQALPSSSQVTQTVSMKSPAVAGNGVSVPGGAFEYEKQVREEGQFVPIYIVRGSVEEGIFSVKIFNGDTYEVNLANGQYAINSVFLFHPNYQEEFARTGVELDASTIPTVKGRLNVAPAVRPGPAVSQQSAPAPGPG